MRSRVAACALAVSGLAVLAGCGDEAVSSSASLDTLGEKMAQPAQDVVALVSVPPADKLTVQDDAKKDRACPGGHQRVYRATSVGTRDQYTANEVRNLVNLAAQAKLKPSGAKLLTRLGKDGSRVPATLDFATSPSDKAAKRTYRTHVDVGATSYTWRITGKTACIKG